MAAGIARTDVGAVATLTLDHPERHNALSTSDFDELEAHLEALEVQQGLACVVVQGAGRSFCAGADLSTASTAAPETALRKSRLLTRLEALPVPVVAKVHGHCIGGGLELALCADLVVAAADARFADAHGRWGLVPAWGLTQRLPRRVGAAQAKLMMFTRRPVSGAEALRIGLADVVVPAAELDQAVDALVADVLAGSAFTHREVKTLLRDTADLPLAAGLAQEHYRLVRRGPGGPSTTQEPR